MYNTVTSPSISATLHTVVGSVHAVRAQLNAEHAIVICLSSEDNGPWVSCHIFAEG